MQRTLVTCPRLVTCDAAHATADNPLGVIEDAAVLLEGPLITDVGRCVDLLTRYADAAIVSAPGVVTPGLVDAHTHAPWMGSRHDEYARRMAGATYEELAAEGGGIVATMEAVRAAKRGTIVKALCARLGRMVSLGVTTVEVKSGYGLDERHERRQLEAAAEASNTTGMPRVVPTYLALHGLPPEARSSRGAQLGSQVAHTTYAARAEQAWLPGIVAAGLCRYVDAYIDRGAFSVSDARPILTRARELGVGVRLHAGQFADIGAAELAAELGAATADHLEHIGPRGIEAMARAGVRAGLLPVASFTLKQSSPPIAAFRAARIPLVVASDANPGTAPTESLPLALAFAVRSYGLAIHEAILGATREAAASLDLAGITGVIGIGLAADLVLWDLPHEDAIVEPWGVSKVLCTVREGVPLYGVLQTTAQ